MLAGPNRVGMTWRKPSNSVGSIKAIPWSTSPSRSRTITASASKWSRLPKPSAALSCSPGSGTAGRCCRRCAPPARRQHHPPTGSRFPLAGPGCPLATAVGGGDGPPAPYAGRSGGGPGRTACRGCLRGDGGRAGKGSRSGADGQPGMMGATSNSRSASISASRTDSSMPASPRRWPTTRRASPPIF